MQVDSPAAERETGRTEETRERSIANDAWECASIRCSAMASIMQTVVVQRGSGSGKPCSHRDKVCTVSPLTCGLTNCCNPGTGRKACACSYQPRACTTRSRGVCSAVPLQCLVWFDVRLKHERPLAVAYTPTELQQYTLLPAVSRRSITVCQNPFL